MLWGLFFSFLLAVLHHSRISGLRIKHTTSAFVRGWHPGLSDRRSSNAGEYRVTIHKMHNRWPIRDPTRRQKKGKERKGNSNKKNRTFDERRHVFAVQLQQRLLERGSEKEGGKKYVCSSSHTPSLCPVLPLVVFLRDRGQRAIFELRVSSARTSSRRESRPVVDVRVD